MKDLVQIKIFEDVGNETKKKEKKINAFLRNVNKNEGEIKSIFPGNFGKVELYYEGLTTASDNYQASSIPGYDVIITYTKNKIAKN